MWKISRVVVLVRKYLKDVVGDRIEQCARINKFWFDQTPPPLVEINLRYNTVVYSFWPGKGTRLVLGVICERS